MADAHPIPLTDGERGCTIAPAVEPAERVLEVGAKAILLIDVGSGVGGLLHLAEAGEIVTIVGENGGYLISFDSDPDQPMNGRVMVEPEDLLPCSARGRPSDQAIAHRLAGFDRELQSHEQRIEAARCVFLDVVAKHLS
jgi:hypothetical protein